MKPIANVLIGCAGWSISSAYADEQCLPKAGSHLQRYAAALSMVEINSSFYRSHRPDTYARWRDSTPTSFRFSVKIPRAITHERKLIDIDDILYRFISEATHLGEKLGCLLVQLPPKLSFNLNIAHDFFNMLATKRSIKVMCEPRHPSWFAKEANELFVVHGVTRVIADPPIQGVEHLSLPKSSEIYIRLHGAPEIYRSRYSDIFLGKLRQWIRLQVDAGLRVWCVFDNTAEGAALGNAVYLQKRILAI